MANELSMKASIYLVQEAAPYRIAIVARPRGDEWLGDELRALSREGVDVLISMLAKAEADELGLIEDPRNALWPSSSL